MKVYLDLIVIPGINNVGYLKSFYKGYEHDKCCTKNTTQPQQRKGIA